MKVNAGLADSNGKLLLGIWRDTLHVTCGLTACTPGSAPGPTLGNEYGKTLLFLSTECDVLIVCRQHDDKEQEFKEQHAKMWENIAWARRLSPPWFQHCGGECPVVPTPLN